METITGNLDVSGIKRFQMPETTILIKCPKCGNVIDVTLIDCIYYPAEGDHHIGVECENCDIEIIRKVDIVSTIVTLNVHDPEVV